MGSRKSRTIVIIGLLSFVLVLSVAYALLSSNLQINTIGKVRGSEWGIIFKNLNSSTIGTAEDDNSSIANGLTIANISAILKKPGDKITYTFDVENNGAIDAKIADIVFGGNYEQYTDLNITFRYNDDKDYGNAVPKEEDALSAGEVRPLTVIIEFDPNSINVTSTDRDFTYTVTLSYIQGQGTLTETDPVGDELPLISGLEFMYPTFAASKGYTITNGNEPNTYILTSSGIEYVFNGVTNSNMTGKNINLSLDIYTSGISGRGAGLMIKLRSPNETDIVNAHNVDYYAVLYDGSMYRIIKSTNGVLNSVSNEIMVNEGTLGETYNIVVKTFNNVIHTELRNHSGQLITQLDYYSNDFDASIYEHNGISYNNNIKIGKVKALSSYAFTNIIAFGDSNTFGESLTPGLRLEESWPGQINSIFTDAGVIAINKGITYHTSWDLVNRLNNDVYANKVTGARNIAIIYIGTNDFNQKYQSYATEFTNLKNNIETMRSGMAANGFEVWMVTFPVCNDPSGPGQGRNPGLRAYNNWIMNDYYGSQKKVAMVIDYASYCQDPNNIDKLIPSCVASDGLHSSASGNNWIALQVQKSLR